MRMMRAAQREFLLSNRTGGGALVKKLIKVCFCRPYGSPDTPRGLKTFGLDEFQTTMKTCDSFDDCYVLLCISAFF
jgi:hypothetical protein